MFHFWSIRYFAGQYLLSYAFQVLKSLSRATGYFMPAPMTAFSTFFRSFSKANSGAWSQRITSHSLAYFSCQALRYGWVLWQLIHEYVQKSTSTTLPRSDASVRGFEFIHSVIPVISGASQISMSTPDSVGFFGIQFPPLHIMSPSASSLSTCVSIFSLSHFSSCERNEKFPFSTT